MNIYQRILFSKQNLVFFDIEYKSVMCKSLKSFHNRWYKFLRKNMCTNVKFREYEVSVRRRLHFSFDIIHVSPYILGNAPDKGRNVQRYKIFLSNFQK